MPEIRFDGRPVQVPPGTNLVDAGVLAGISVPIFCYHKDLGAIGSCRICAVTVKQGDKSRLVMGCMTEAQDGMEVTTLDPASRGVRKWVTEFLMINHPHDCPICDEGGECQLQDLTIATEHGIRRTELKKRTFDNQYLGEFIQHEMNRCITCYRCSRFYQEYAGGRDFGSTGSRNRVYFGRFEDGKLESPFSGNLVEMCPTGVFTDKLFRYKTRVWDLEIAPSICPHCSVGCNVLPGSRHREVQRVRVRDNPAVNGAFMCDRGQFGHGYVMSPSRPRALRVNGEASQWDSALGEVAGALLETARVHGAKTLALIGSPRASVETLFALTELAAGPLAGARISLFDDPDREARALACLGALRHAGAAPLEQSDIADCDVLLVAGASLVDEAPLAALAARQVARRGGRVFVLSPLERYLGDVATVVPMHPGALEFSLRAIASGASDDSGAGAALRDAARPGVLLGSDLLDGEAIMAGAEIAKALAVGGKPVRFGTLFPGPNGFGAAALSSGAHLSGMLADLEAGAFLAAVVVEGEWSSWSPRARQALEQLPLLVVLGHVPGGLADRAKAFLPTTATYESNGLYVNRAGRAQGFAQVRMAGRSVAEEIQGESFRRTYQRQPSDSDARMAWWILEGLRGRCIGKPDPRGLEGLRAALADRHPGFAPARDVRAGTEGAALDVQQFSPPAVSVPRVERGNCTQLFRVERTLGSELLSRHSEPMREMAGEPAALLSPADAQRLGINGRVSLDVGGGSVELAARAQPGVPDGVVLVPRDVEWPLVPPQGAAVRPQAATTAEVVR